MQVRISKTENELGKAVMDIYLESGLPAAVFDGVLSKAVSQIKELKAVENAGMIADLVEALNKQEQPPEKEGEEDGNS